MAYTRIAELEVSYSAQTKPNTTTYLPTKELNEGIVQ